jgi:hypothetical protein
MSLLSSFPGGMAALGWRRLFLTALAFVLAPVLVGAAAYSVATLLGPAVLGGGYLRTLGMATLAFVSPLFGLPIWAMMALGAGLLLKVDRFGALPAALLGTLLFASLVRTDIGLIGLPFGAVSGLLYRMALALQRPEAF